MNQRHRAALTEAVNAYARACGGTTEATAVDQERVKTFIAIERIIREVEANVRGGVDVCSRCGDCLAPVEPPAFCEACRVAS